MKPFILCLNAYDAIEDIRAVISYKNRLERMSPITKSSNALFFWSYAYVNYKGLDVDPYNFDPQGLPKCEFYITIHLCKSYERILERCKKLYEDGVISCSIMDFAHSAMLVLLRDKSYMDNLYNICPLDYNHPTGIDDLAIKYVMEHGLDPAYA